MNNQNCNIGQYIKSDYIKNQTNTTINISKSQCKIPVKENYEIKLDKSYQSKGIISKSITVRIK